MNRDHVVSHSSAGLIHQLPMLRVNDTLVHITRPGVTGSRTEFGVKHHRAHFEHDQVVEVDGVAVHDLARTAVDIGRELGYLHGLVACDASLQLGVSKGDLYKALDPMTCWPYVTRTRAAVEDADPGAESVGETLAREFLISLGLGPVTTQFSVITGGQLHFADLRIGRHLVEFDGRGKYRRSDRGGLADRDPEEVVWAEKTRQNLICGEGYGMSRLTWDDVWGPGREAAAERVSREFTITTQRFGASLPPGYQAVVRRRRTA